MVGDDTRSRILDAAGPAFAEFGYQGTTIREICRRADVNLASVNYHFGDKERLYIETIKHAHRLRFSEVPLPEWSDDTPAEEKLRDFIRVTLTRMLATQESSWQRQLMTRELLSPTSACREMVESYIRPHFELLLSILTELVPPETPEHRRHQLAFSTVGQCIFYRFHAPVISLLISPAELDAHYTPGQLAEHIADLVLAALRREPISLAAGS
jgi:AcrR family transcriptional regulator